MSIMERVVFIEGEEYKPHKLIVVEGARLLRETLDR
jgi:hypothetical protein